MGMFRIAMMLELGVRGRGWGSGRVERAVRVGVWVEGRGLRLGSGLG